MCSEPTVGACAAVLNNAFDAFRSQSVTVSARATVGAASATTAITSTHKRCTFMVQLLSF